MYQQLDDAAMGSPLSSLFADIFMSFHEQSWLNQRPSSFKPLLYRLYIDDCFLLFYSSDHVPLFLDYLNQQHPNITFIAEVEQSRKLSLSHKWKIHHFCLPLAYFHWPLYQLPQLIQTFTSLLFTSPHLQPLFYLLKFSHATRLYQKVAHQKRFSFTHIWPNHTSLPYQHLCPQTSCLNCSQKAHLS